MKTLSQNAKTGKSLDLGGELMKNLDFTGSRKKLKDILARFDVMLEKMVDEHEEARKHTQTGHVKDLLDILLDIKHDESMEIKLTRQNIKALIQRNLSELWRNRSLCYKKSDIPNLPYLQAIVKETFRLHPATPLVTRQSPQDCTVAGYHIPANTTVLINIWALNRDPNHWEKPHEFRPEIFEDNMLNAGKDGTLLSVDMEEGTGQTLPRANPLFCIPVALFDPIPFSVSLLPLKKPLLHIVVYVTATSLPNDSLHRWNLKYLEGKQHIKITSQNNDHGWSHYKPDYSTGGAGPDITNTEPINAHLPTLRHVSDHVSGQRKGMSPSAISGNKYSNYQVFPNVWVTALDPVNPGKQMLPETMISLNNSRVLHDTISYIMCTRTQASEAQHNERSGTLMSNLAQSLLGDEDAKR
ncbi:cytochrome P450 93A3-like protein [Tanacetum coccineum]